MGAMFSSCPYYTEAPGSLYPVSNARDDARDTLASKTRYVLPAGALISKGVIANSRFTSLVVAAEIISRPFPPFPLLPVPDDARRRVGAFHLPLNRAARRRAYDPSRRLITTVKPRERSEESTADLARSRARKDGDETVSRAKIEIVVSAFRRPRGMFAKKRSIAAISERHIQNNKYSDCK